MDESKTRKAPKRLFDDFIFESELCILFADANVGKSILAVQIADAIAGGFSFGIQPETEPQKVIYCDFELSDKQFEARYSQHEPGAEHFTDQYIFPENFIRVEINPNADFENFDSFKIKV